MGSAASRAVKPSPGRRMKVAVVVNAGSGTILRLGVEESLATLENALAVNGIEPELKLAAGEELRAGLEAALSRAKRGEVGAVVVGGGDGSVRTAAGVLAGTGVPLGILPLGTLNHFAKDVGIPTELDAAAVVIAKGEARPIDVAEVNGEVFINNSSIGIYPYMVLDRERRRDAEGWPKWIAMALAFMRMLRQFPRRRLAVCLELSARPYRTPCLFIGNNQYAMDLLALGKRDRLDRGELWLCIVKQRHPLGFLWLGLRAAFGLLDQAADLEVLQASAAEIRSRASRLAVALDGEVEILRTPLRYRARPAALRVLSPPPLEV
jgi:diacylglycerol kinase family enzyme